LQGNEKEKITKKTARKIEYKVTMLKEGKYSIIILWCMYCVTKNVFSYHLS